MQTEIKLKTSELNVEFLAKVQAFLKGRTEANIKITISDEDDYYEVLDRSLREAKQKKNLISFTLEELMSFDTDAAK